MASFILSARHDVMGRRIDRHMADKVLHLTGDGVDLC